MGRHVSTAIPVRTHATLVRSMGPYAQCEPRPVALEPDHPPRRREGVHSSGQGRSSRRRRRLCVRSSLPRETDTSLAICTTAVQRRRRHPFRQRASRSREGIRVRRRGRRRRRAGRHGAVVVLPWRVVLHGGHSCASRARDLSAAVDEAGRSRQDRDGEAALRGLRRLLQEGARAQSGRSSRVQRPASEPCGWVKEGSSSPSPTQASGCEKNTATRSTSLQDNDRFARRGLDRPATRVGNAGNSERHSRQEDARDDGERRRCYTSHRHCEYWHHVRESPSRVEGGH